MKTVELEINDIIVDFELYPRVRLDWHDIYAFVNAMKTGAVFPPILVGKFEDKLYLVDGLHRIKAYQRLKLTKISAKVKKYSSRREIRIDAIETNSKHGVKLEFCDNVLNFSRLRKDGLSDPEISRLLRTPIEKFEVIVSRIRTVEGKDVSIKSILERAIKKQVITENDLSNIIKEGGQSVYSSYTVNHAFEEVIKMLEHKIINWNDTESVALATRLFSLLSANLGVEIPA